MLVVFIVDDIGNVHDSREANRLLGDWFVQGDEILLISTVDLSGDRWIREGAPD